MIRAPLPLTGAETGSPGDLNASKTQLRWQEHQTVLSANYTPLRKTQTKFLQLKLTDHVKKLLIHYMVMVFTTKPMNINQIPDNSCKQHNYKTMNKIWLLYSNPIWVAVQITAHNIMINLNNKLVMNNLQPWPTNKSKECFNKMELHVDHRIKIRRAHYKVVMVIIITNNNKRAILT